MLTFTGGRVSDVLAEVNVRLAEADPTEHRFLLRWQAVAHNHLGHYIAAMESARTALEINVADDDLDTTALIYASIGTAYSGIGRHDEALRALRLRKICCVNLAMSGLWAQCSSTMPFANSADILTRRVLPCLMTRLLVNLCREPT